jgi:hypothetical protein
MTGTDYPWSVYERLQRASARSRQSGSREYAIDAGLDYLLSAIAAGTVPIRPADLETIVARVMATAARRRRHRTRLTMKWGLVDEKDAFLAAHARHLDLLRAGSAVAGEDTAILIDVGKGFTDREIASRRGTTPGAVRIRLARLRKRVTLAAESGLSPNACI